MGPDFSGYVTKFNVKCTDGRTITPSAFEHQDGEQVPLVWDHKRNDIENILGHVKLEHRADGTYGYAFFNESTKAKHAKAMVEHKDLNSMSIFAEKLIERAKDVYHGVIGEVSLVLAGANPEAKIDYVTIQHSDGFTEVSDAEAVIYSNEKISLEHADGDDDDDDDDDDDKETVGDVIASMNEKQRAVFDLAVSEALKSGGSAEHSDNPDDSDEGEDSSDDDNNDDSDDTDDSDDNNDGTDGTDETDEGDALNHKEGQPMTRNAFEQYGATGNGTVTAQKTLSHSQVKSIIEKAEEIKSFKGAVEHFLEHATEYGIEDIDMLFPDAKAITSTPEFVKRRTEWVNQVLSGTHHSPFSRVKTLFADITHEEARAKGYIKTTLKKEEFIKLSRRVTTPKTVYKKQKLDRDDLLDITDFEVVAWLKAEMRLMLEEELARAILISDGREADDPDKINEEHVRPIAYEDDFFAPKIVVSANTKGQNLVEAVIRSRKRLRGSGGAAFYTHWDVIADMLLAKDRLGNRMYRTIGELEAGMGVSKIVDVEVMGDQDPDLLGILVNLRDYTVGADRGGQTTFFEDFDIDYNQMKYLYETRLSGSLTRWRSALVFRRAADGTSVTPTEPTFVEATGVVTIPDVTGVRYDNHVTGTALEPGDQPALAEGDSLYVQAYAESGYYFAPGTDDDWEFTRPVA